MTRPRIAQIHQSGATDAQVMTWSAALGYWIPATPSPITFCRSAFTAVGGETVIYIGVIPVTASEAVHVNGLLKLWTTDYTISGSTITLTTPLSTSDKVALTYAAIGACGVASLGKPPKPFHRPVPVTRPVRRFHRIR